jgi:hypothetical protein
MSNSPHPFSSILKGGFLNATQSQHLLALRNSKSDKSNRSNKGAKQKVEAIEEAPHSAWVARMTDAGCRRPCRSSWRSLPGPGHRADRSRCSRFAWGSPPSATAHWGCFVNVSDTRDACGSRETYMGFCVVMSLTCRLICGASISSVRAPRAKGATYVRHLGRILGLRQLVRWSLGGRGLRRVGWRVAGGA